MGSSPHTRGALSYRCRAGRAGRIIPAYAGSTGRGLTVGAKHRDHPRIRGEHFARDAELLFGEGSSPHTRGARYREIGFETIDRIIPAYAGSTLGDWLADAGLADHPRIRGEHWEAPPERPIL